MCFEWGKLTKKTDTSFAVLSRSNESIASRDPERWGYMFVLPKLCSVCVQSSCLTFDHDQGSFPLDQRMPVVHGTTTPQCWSA